MPIPPTRDAANAIPAGALALLSPQQRRAIQAAAIGPTDEDKTTYCESCRRISGPSSPLCDRCTMEGLLRAIAFLGDLVTAPDLVTVPTPDAEERAKVLDALVEAIGFTQAHVASTCAEGHDLTPPTQLLEAIDRVRDVFGVPKARLEETMAGTTGIPADAEEGAASFEEP